MQFVSELFVDGHVFLLDKCAIGRRCSMMVSSRPLTLSGRGFDPINGFEMINSFLQIALRILRFKSIWLDTSRWHNRFHGTIDSTLIWLRKWLMWSFVIRSFVIPNLWVARSRKIPSEGTTVYDEVTTLMMKKPLYMMKKPFLWWRNHFIWWRNRSTQNHTVKKPVWNLRYGNRGTINKPELKFVISDN